MQDLIDIAGFALTQGEIDAACHLSAKQWIAPQPNQWGSLAVLRVLALFGIAAQCGRLFHALPAAHRIAKAAA